MLFSHVQCSLLLNAINKSKNSHLYDNRWDYSQCAPVFVGNGSLKNNRHIGDGDANALIFPQLKFTISNCQVVDLQTTHEETVREPEHRQKPFLQSQTSTSVTTWILVYLLV